MSTRFSLVICLAALALAAALPGVAQAADGNGTDQAPVTLTDDQISALEAASGQDSGDQGVFQDVSDFVTDNAPFFIIGIVVLAAIIAGIFIMRGRSRPEGAAGSSSGAGPPSAAEMKRRKRAAIQRSREEERLRRKGGVDPRRQTGQEAPSAASGTAAGAGVAAGAGIAAGAASGAAVDPVAAEKQGARDQRMAAAAVARSGGAIPAPPSPSQTAPSAAVTATPPPAPPVAGPEPDTVVTGAPQANPSAAAPPPSPQAPQAPPPSLQAPQASQAPPEAPQTGAALAAGAAAGAAGGAIAGRATSSASPPDEQAPDQAAHDAEARLRAKVEEIKAEQAGAAAAPLAEEQIHRVEEMEHDLEKSDPMPPLTPGLASVERRLSADSEERDRTLREAEERLRRIERRAEDAERRAAFAERLAQLKIEESDRERRLNEVVSGIDRAEERAREAEARAESAERAAAAALEERSVPRADLSGSGPAESPSAEAAPHQRPQGPQKQHAPEAGTGVFSGRETGQTQDPPRENPAPAAATVDDPDAIDLNSATFEDLRDADLSVTQATRILAYRERFGGYRSVDDLEKVPGFPDDLIESLRGRITV